MNKSTAGLAATAVLALATVGIAAPASATTTPDPVKGSVTMYWKLPAGGTANAADPNIWPQTPTTAPAVTEACEGYIVQKDTYVWNNQAEKDAIDAFGDDGFLRNGEDHAYVTHWEFITVATNPALCAPVVVIPPKPAKVTTDDSTEGAPNCDSKQVAVTDTHTVTGWKYDEATNTWIQRKPVVTVTESTREATAEECPVIVPPVDTPPVDTPPAVDVPVVAPKPTTKKPATKAPVKVPAKYAPHPTVAPAAGYLPDTGGPTAIYLGSGLALLLVGAGVVIAARRGRDDA